MNALRSGLRVSTRVLIAAGVVISGMTGGYAQFAEADITVLYTIQSGTPGDNYGFVAESIGDLNGDGASEIIVGATNDASGGTLAGKAYVYSGADGALIHTLSGGPFERMGHGVAGVGDTNLDGYPDYAVTGPGTFGGPGAQPGRLVVVSGADHSILIDIDGPGDRSFFGYDVGAAGDVNGDGAGDVIVGAPLDSTSAFFAGRVHVISGIDGSTLWTADGVRAQAFQGTGVSGVDDQNGDGVPDQAVGAIGDGNFATGQAYVLDGVDGSILRTLKSKQQTGFAFGDFFVQDAGDVDNDGIHDIYVGDYADTDAGPGAGRAYVFFGGTDDRRIFDSEGPGNGFGIGRGAGDVDDDSHDDLVIAAYTSSAGAPGAGKMYVYSGRNGKLVRTMTGTVANEQMGFDALAVGDVNGDGLIDFLITGVNTQTGTGRGHVIAGNPAPGPGEGPQ